MNNDNPIDYNAVLADLEGKRAALDAAIMAVKSILGQPVSSAPSVYGVAVVGGTEVLPDSFFAMSIPDATKKFLGMKKRPQTTPDIKAALLSGGISTTGNPETFGNTVGSVLNRNYIQGGGIVKIGRGTWGLAEWYPNKPRKPSSKELSEEKEEDNSSAD